MKAKLRQIGSKIGKNALSFRGLAFLLCAVLCGATVALLAIHDTPPTKTDDTKKSQITLNPGSFTISDPSKLQSGGGVLSLIDQGGGTYATDSPYVTSTNPISYQALGGFTQSLGSNNAGQIGYRISPDNANWYWWDEGAWNPITVSNTINDVNTAAELNDHLDEFAGQFGAGDIYIRAFFVSNGMQQVELQSVTLDVYANPAPTLTDVSPAFGPVAGGTNVTVTGTNFMPDLDPTPYDTTTNTWTNAGSTTHTSNYRSLAVIGDTIYLFGGYSPSSSAIYSAPVSDPTNMTYTGKTLPGTQCCTQVAVIGDYAYMFGGYNSSAIWRASVSDPTTWSTTGVSMPATGEGVGFYMVDDMLYYVVGTAIYSASASNPLVWTNTNKSIAGASRYPLITKIDSTVYFYSGNKIYTAPASDPATWTDTGKTLPGSISSSASGSQLGIIGDNLYIYSGNSIYSAPVSDPTTWTNTGISSPANGSNSSWALIGDKMYLYSGANIYSAPVTGSKPNVYNFPWLTDRISVNLAGLSSIDFGGVPATNLQTLNSTTATATVPPHAAGAVDVVVTGYDGQSATLTNGFEYISPLAVSGVSPDSGSIAGGDSVTITGDGFRNDSTVKFGNNDAASVTYINRSTLVAVTPPGIGGAVNVTVINPGAETATYTAGFTYVNPAPQVSSVDPSSGPSSGGTDVAIHGSGFVPPNAIDNTSWQVSDDSLPNAVGGSNAVIVGDKIYLFGGYLYPGGKTANIYSAPVSDPTNWTNETANDPAKHLPTAQYSSQVMVIGDTVWLFGGHEGSRVIYSAPVSDPTNWTDTGELLPNGIGLSTSAIIGDKIYIFGGYSGSSALNNIYSAPVSDPTNWTNETANDPAKHLPTAKYGMAIAVIDDTIYLYGGQASTTATNTIYSAPVSDPTNWTDVTATTSKVLPGTTSQMRAFVIGDKVYIFNSSGGVYSAPVSDPTTWSSVSNNIPVGATNTQFVIVGDALYAYGGTSSAAIKSASLTQYQSNYYMPSWLTTWSTVDPSSDQSAVLFDGVPATNVTFVSSTEVTATTPTHSSGEAVDVEVKNFDGGSGTLVDGYEYISAPSIAGMNPDSGSTTGGDSVTITGTGFQDGAIVKFGDAEATDVTYINSTTLIATTPANRIGAIDVTVTNPDTQTVTLWNEFTYLNPPPQVSSVDPSSGPVAGNTPVTITGSGFLPPNVTTNTWEAVTQSGMSALQGYEAAIIGDKAYIFGGSNTNAIYSASISNPTVWTLSVDTLPTNLANSQLAVIRDRVYLFGGTVGSSTTDNIYSAPVSDPTNWTNVTSEIDANMRLPQARSGARIRIIGDTIYMFGGGNGSTATNTIFTAPVSDPTNWTDVTAESGGTVHLPGPLQAFQLVVNKDAIYAIGGLTANAATSSSRSIYSAPVSDPTNWTNTDKLLPVPLSLSAVRIVNDTIYLLGGTTNVTQNAAVYTADISDPTTFTSSGKSLPNGRYNALALTINGAMYYIGGLNAGSTPVLKADTTFARPNVFDPPWTTSWGTVSPYTDQSSVTFDGVPATDVEFVSPTQITATTPAHTAGFVDVEVTNYDGQSATLTEGFEYLAPPTVTGASPSSGSTVGGDTVTLTGTGFQDGATVKFGSAEATSVTYVNSTTLIAMSPVNNAGSVDITVTNPDSQQATLEDGFTYLNPPPQVSSVDPDSGPVAGGTNVTITGSGFVPPNTTDNVWAVESDGTLPAARTRAATVVIGDTIYMFGGLNTNTIYSAPVSDPTNWTDTGRVLPGALSGSQVAVIENTIYLFGGRLGSGSTTTPNIYSAPVSDPTTWTDTGFDLPGARAFAQSAIIEDRLYLFGGDSGSGPTNTIFSAPLSDLSSWTNHSPARVLPAVLSAAQLAVIGDTVYLLGGNNTTTPVSTIFSAPVSDPTNWTNTGKTLPSALQGPQLAVIGDTVYLLGGYYGSARRNVIYSAPVSDPTTWTNTNKTLAANSYLAQLAVIDDKIYLFGGDTGSATSTIYSTSTNWHRPNYYMPSWLTNWPTVNPSSDQSAVLFDGNPASNVNFVSSTEITATTPPHTAGFVDVEVTNYDGQSDILTSGYTYIPPPEILAVNPDSGPMEGGDVITITGSDFVDGATVKFGNIDAANVVFVDSNTLIVTTPSTSAGRKNVSVTNPDGQTGLLEGGYLFTRPPPSITSITPDMGTMTGGTDVVIAGTGFPIDVAATANGGSASANASYSSNTSDKAFDGDDATAWTGSGGSGYWVQSIFDDTYSIGQIKWTACGSDNGPRQAQIQLYQNDSWVTIHELADAQASGDGDGTGYYTLPVPEEAAGIRFYFNNAGGWVTCHSLQALAITSDNAVTFDGIPATDVIYGSPTEIRAKTPAHAPGKVDVTVTDEFGQSVSLADGYQYLPDNYAFTTASLSVAATEPGTLTVEARDIEGNPVTSTEDITLQLATNSDSGFFARDLNEDESTRWNYDSVVLPAGQSEVTFYYKDNLEGTPTVTVTDPSGTEVQQQQTIGPRYKLLVTGVTDPVQAGIPSSITIQAVDYQGQPQTDYTGTIHFTSTDGGALLPADFTFTPEMLGLHTFVNGVSMRTQGEWCVTATDTVSASITGEQCGITVTAPNAGTISKLEIISPPQSFPADGSSSAITVQAQDVDGLPIPVASDTTIYVYSSSGTGQFSADGQGGWTGSSPFEVTIPAGATATSVYYKDSMSGTHTVTMRDDEGTGTDFGWTNASQQVVVGVGNPTKLGVAAPVSASAGEWVPVTIHLQDSGGNDVTSLGNITLRLEGDSETAQFSNNPAGGSPAASINAVIPAGSATTTVYVSDIQAHELVITANDVGSNPYDSGNAVITIGPGEPVALVFLPVTDPARVHEPKQLVAYLQDIYGNVTSAVDTVDVAFATSGSEGKFSTSASGPWSSTASVSIPVGTSNAPIYYLDTKVGEPTITATASEFVPTTLDLSVVAGPYSDSLKFTTAPTQFTAGEAQTVAVSLMDDYGNPTIAEGNAAGVTIETSNGTGEFSVDGGVTWVSSSVPGTVPVGQGTFTVQYRDTKAGAVTFRTVITGDWRTRDSYQATIAAAAPAKYTFVSNPQIIAKNTTSAPIIIEVQDQYDNPASVPADFSAMIATTSNNGEFSRNGDSWTAGSLAVPFAEGASQATVYYRDSTVSIYTLDVSGNGLVGVNQDIRIVEGIVSKINLSSSGNTIANEPIAVTLSTQTDAGIETSVIGDTDFSLDGVGEFSLAESPWEPITTVSLHDGESSKTLYYRSTEAGINTITADETPSQGWTQGSADITVGGGEFYQFGFTAKPASVPVTEASGVFVVSALDIYGNVTMPDTDTTVYLYSDASSGTFGASSSGPWDVTAVTINAGNTSASFYYRDTTLGEPTITASDKSPLETPDEDIVNAVTNIDVVGQLASKLSFTTAPQTIEAGSMTSVITIQLQKSDNSPAIQDTDRTFTFDGASSSSDPLYFSTPDMGGTPITQVTIPRGASSVSFYATATGVGIKEMHPYMFNYPGIGLIHERQSLTVLAAAPESLAFTTTPQAIHANEDSAQIKVELRDTFGNTATAVSDVEVTFASSCDNGQFSLANGSAWNSITSATIPAGGNAVYFYYRDVVAGICMMTVSTPGLNDAVQDIEITNNAAAALEFTTTPQTIVAGQNSDTITVSAVDVVGNIATVDQDTRIYFSTSSPTGQFTPSSIIMPAGESSVDVTYRDTAPGNPTLRARDHAGMTDTGLIDGMQGITITEGEETALAIEPNEFNVAAGQLRQLSVVLRNEYDAPIRADNAVAVSLASTGDGEYKATNDPSAPNITEITIPAGSSSVTVYYRQTTAAAGTLLATDPNNELAEGSATATVYAEALKGMQFITGPQTLEANQPSGAMTVQAVDEFGNATNFAPTPMTVYLYSSSSTGKFYSDAGFTDQVTSLRITGSTTTATFYYRDAALGDSTITVSDRSPLDNPDVGLTNAVQTVTIEPGAPAKLAIVGGSDELERGGVDGPNYAVLQNAYDVEIDATANQLVYLSSNSITADFSETTAGPWQDTRLVVIPAGESRAAFYYRDDDTLGQATITASDVSAPPESPDSGLINGTKLIDVVSGAFAQLTFSTPPQTIIARHPSTIMTVEALNRYGRPTTVTADTTLYLRSNAATGEFAQSASGPWGIATMTIPADSSSISFYYRDSKDGSPTIRVSNSLSTDPTEVIATTQQQIIERQVLSHFLVTNISDPQYQGNPSSVVVAAVDSENFVIDWYAGRVSFTASDSDAVLPDSYTFNPSKDKGIHTFTNEVAFRSAGEKTVGVTDENGITGEQTDITVLGNPAGPPAKLVFIEPTVPPLTVAKGQVSQVVTLQIQDSANMPTNAGPGGFPVRLATTADSGEFSLSPTGPWQSAATFSVPAGLNYVNLYYRDSEVGTPTITASDWTGNVDNPAIGNATLDVIVNALQLNAADTVSSRNFANTFVSNPTFFAYDNQGSVVGRASFTADAREERNNALRPVNWQLTWKDGQGTIIGQQDYENTSQISYEPSDITARAGDNPFTLELQATDPDTGEISQTTRSIAVSPWQAAITTQSAYALETPITFQIETREQQALKDATQGSVQILDSSFQPVGTQAFLTSAQHKGPGSYELSMLAPTLTVGQTYYGLVRLLDTSGDILAEDLSGPFQVTAAPDPGGDDGGNPTNPDNGSGDGPGDGGATNPGEGNNGGASNGDSGSENGQDGNDINSPNQNNGAAGGIGSGSASGGSSDSFFASLGEAIKRIFSSPATPIVISNGLFGIVILMAVILLWQAWKELRQVRLLLAILDREKQTAEDKDNFLQLCAHYLRTPITIISASSEMLVSKLGESYAEATQTLGTVVKNLQQKTEQIIAQTTGNESLQAINTPDIAVERRKLYRSPIFWMPVILSIVLTVLGNWAASTIGEQSVHTAVLLEQVGIAIVAIILLYTGIRLRAMRRRRKELLAESLRRRAELDRAKNQFVTTTYDLLAGDVYLLAKTQRKLPAEEKFVQMVGDGTKRLEKLMDKFKLLATIDSTQLTVSGFTTTQLVNQALDELSEELKAKEITVDRHEHGISLQQDSQLLERVVSSVLANATEFNNPGGTISISAAQHKDTATIKIQDNGPGFKQDPEQLFEAFKRGDDSLDFTHEGIGLDLYLDRLIMRHLGGNITARNHAGHGAEVILTLPAQAV